MTLLLIIVCCLAGGVASVALAAVVLLIRQEGDIPRHNRAVGLGGALRQVGMIVAGIGAIVALHKH